MINFRLSVFIIFFIFINMTGASSQNIKILYKIDNKVLTNIDIENEARYLTALSPQLKKLSKDKILIIAEESLLREAIKGNELKKYFNLDQKNPFLDTLIENIYLKLEINSLNEFKEYLKVYNLSINEIKKKIEIESSWNTLIYDKYENQIVVNKDKIEKVLASTTSNKKSKSFQLSEILFEIEKNQTIDKKKNLINESINEIGFKNTANFYSIADSRKFGGDIGWVDEKNLSKKIANALNNLEIGEHSKIIQIGVNYLILKIEDKKEEKIIVNKDAQMKKMITFEMDRQLNKFSNIYFNKIKINTIIDAL